MSFNLLESFAFSPYLLVFATGWLLYWCIKTKQSGWGWRLSLVVLIAQVLFVNSFVVALITLPLRAWIPDNSEKQADAIVVHGSSTHITGAATSGSSVRGYLGGQVFLSGRAPVILMMGYSATDSLGSAKAMRVIARGMGVPKSQILIVGGKTTYDEAQKGGALLRGRGIASVILVSSWYHMPRVRAVWAAQGFDVITHTHLPKLDFWSGFFDWHHYQVLRWVCHEYAGIFVYWLRGWV